MSSTATRSSFKTFMAANSSESVIDLTGEFDELRVLIDDNNLQPDAPWLGLEFIGDDEIPVSLSATNDKGLYRETGSIILHVCAVAKIGVGADLINRGEVLRDLLRGRRIDAIVIEGVTPMNTGPGATLEFDGGYVSGSITISYHADNNL